MYFCDNCRAIVLLRYNNVKGGTVSAITLFTTHMKKRSNNNKNVKNVKRDKNNFKNVEAT